MSGFELKMSVLSLEALSTGGRMNTRLGAFLAGKHYASKHANMNACGSVVAKAWPQVLYFLAVVLIFCASGAAAAADRLELEDTAIKGAKELPKVLYIVPWKNTQLSSMDSLVGDGSFDSTMVPLDRYTFRREINYHLLLQGEGEGDSQ